MRDHEYEEKLVDPAKIVICIKGGLIEWAKASEPVEVAVIDLDIEGASEDELTRVTLHGGPILVFAESLSLRDKSVNPESVNSIFNEILAGEEGLEGDDAY